MAHRRFPSEPLPSPPAGKSELTLDDRDRGKTKLQLLEELRHLRQYVRQVESRDRILQEKERKLAAAQQAFDRLVEERTEALKAANDELIAEIVERTRVERELRSAKEHLQATNDELVSEIVKSACAERELRSAKEQLQAILEAVPGMVSWVSCDLRYLGVNQHLAKTFDLPPKEFVGKKLGFLGIGQEFINFVKRLFAMSDSYIYQEVGARVGGDRRSFLMVAQKYDRDRAAFVIGIDITERRQALDKLERLASLDGLTQVANRRSFDETLDREWRRMLREGLPLSLVLCDIDHFKTYNDTYGHQAGDDCLKQVARALQKVTRRPADVAARYGGEEFALILPNTPIDGARTIAENARSQLRSLQIRNENAPTSPYVTFSIGIASGVPDAQATPEQLLARADRALYKAKKSGRDRICCAAD